MNRLTAVALVCLGVSLFAAPSVATAQTTQDFKVIVPSRMLISATNGSATITHNETDTDQTFTAEQWTVKANKLNGVTVTFSTGSAFVNATDSDYKNDAQLDLSVTSTVGPAAWTLDTATDVTNHGGGDHVATVQASSDKPGMATFDLVCKCKIGTSFWEMLEGDYDMTVTGTVTAN